MEESYRNCNIKFSPVFNKFSEEMNSKMNEIFKNINETPNYINGKIQS
jgi:hypothetical protein